MKDSFNYSVRDDGDHCCLKCTQPQVLTKHNICVSERDSNRESEQMIQKQKNVDKTLGSGLLLKASLYVKVISLLLKECCRVTTNTFILHLFSAVCSSSNTRHLKRYLSQSEQDTSMCAKTTFVHLPQKGKKIHLGFVGHFQSNKSESTNNRGT